MSVALIQPYVTPVTDGWLGFHYGHHQVSREDTFSPKGQTTGNGGAQHNRPKAKARAAVLPKGETKMTYQFLNLLQGIWSSWTGLFKVLPYGDPYIATLAMVVVFAMTLKMIVSGKIA